MLAILSTPSLADRVVFVTGGGSGMGAAIVPSIARKKTKVAFIDTDEAASARVQSKVAGMNASGDAMSGT
jgi:D-xylose 1-dehydrogenase